MARGAEPVPRHAVACFLLAAAYVACPVLEIPLTDFSLSAPLLYMVALEVVGRPREDWFRFYRVWVRLALFLGMGVLLSLAWANVMPGGSFLGFQDLRVVARHLYWFLVMVVATYVTSRARLGPRVVVYLSAGVAATACLRWIEAALFSNAASGWTVFLSRNNYAVIMTAFMPTLLPAVVSARGLKRWLAAGGLVATLGAVLINASRGGWLGAMIGIFLFAVYFTFFFRRRPSGLAVALVVAGGLFGLYRALPGSVVNLMLGRPMTSQEIRLDKSAQIRLLMMQKSWRLFQESPVFGVGAGRFTKTFVPLDLPRILRYQSEEFFNKKSAHNSYAHWLAETGLVGSIPLLALLLFLGLKGALATARLVRGGELWAAGLFSGFVAMSAHLWVLSGITNTGTWLFYGLVASIIVTDGWQRRIALYRQQVRAAG